MGNANGVHSFDGFDPDGYGPDAWRTEFDREPMRKPKPLRVPQLEFADNSEPELDASHDLIKGIIRRGDNGSIIGPPGASKTTLALFVCFHVALGIECQERRVRGGPVLYVSYEGEAGIRNRIAAARKRYGQPGKRFARLVMPPTLNKTDAGTDGARFIVEAVRQLEAAAGESVALIVLDTRSRATAGDDENSASDAATFVEHRVGEIIRQTGAAVLTLHHTGKDENRGARGSSAGLGAADLEITLSQDKDSGTRTATMTKVRDGAEGVWLSYALDVVELGRDTDGDPVTACVIAPRVAEPRAAKVKLTNQSRRALDELNRLYDEGEARDVPLAEIGLEGISEYRRPRVVSLPLWRERCYAAQLVSDGKPDSERKAFGRAAGQLEDAGRIARRADFVWLLGQSRSAGQSGTWRDVAATCPGTDRDTTLGSVPPVPRPPHDPRQGAATETHSPHGQPLPGGLADRADEGQDGEAF